MEESISENNFISKTMLFMAMGLVVTFLSGYILMNNLMYLTKGMFIGAIFLEIVLVLVLRSLVQKMSPLVASMCFLLYSAVSGVTFSVIFLAYSVATILTVFVIAAIMFFCSAMIGITTKKDLSVMARFLYMGLIGLVLIGFTSLFIPSLAFNKLVAIIGIIIFSALTAYDMQKVKNIHENAYNMDPSTVNRYVIIAALELYLDFINIFLYLLRFAKSSKR